MDSHVRDEGVAGSNPATPTTAKSLSRKDIRRYDPEADRVVCTQSRTRFDYSPDVFEAKALVDVFVEDENGARKKTGEAEQTVYLDGFLVFDRLRGRCDPLAFTFSVATAETIVEALNRLGPGREWERAAANYEHMKGVASANGFDSLTEAVTVARNAREGR